MSFHQAGPEGLLAPDLVEFQVLVSYRVRAYDSDDAVYRFYEHHVDGVIEEIEEV